MKGGEIMEFWDIDWKDHHRKDRKKDFFKRDDDDNDNKNKNTNIIDIDIEIDLRKKRDHKKRDH